MRFPVNHALPLAALILLGGCIGGGGPMAAPEPLATTGPAADYPVVLGAPFAIEGTTYTPTDAMNSDAVGYASAGNEGGGAISIAHKTLPLPSYAEVTSLVSGKTILVRVERRGPMVNDRAVELSPGAADQLGVAGTDKTPVRIRRVNPPEVERALLRSGQRAPDRMETPQSLLTVLKRKLDPASIAAPVPQPEPSATPTAEPVLAKPVKTRPAVRPRPVPSPSATTSPAPSVSPAPAPSPSAKPTPRPRPTPKASPSPKPSPTPRATPSARPSPRATPSPTAATVRTTPGGQFFVQVGSYANRQNADTAARKVGGSVRGGERINRVLMGPYSTRAQADAALAKARSAGYRDAQVQTTR